MFAPIRRKYKAKQLYQNRINKNMVENKKGFGKQYTRIVGRALVCIDSDRRREPLQ